MRGLAALILLSSLTACAAHVSLPERVSSEGGDRKVAGSVVLRAQMLGLSQALQNEGFRLSDPTLDVFLPQGARHAEELSLPAHTCIALVAIGSAAVVDLDAGLYTPDGEALAEDDNVDARPVLSLCSGSEPRRLYYTLHAYQGGGAVLARSFVRPEGPRDRSLPSATAGSLSDWAAVSARLKARGFTDDGPATDMELSAGDALRVAIPAKSGSCYTWIGEADASLRGVSMRVLDGSGRELARGEDDGGPVALQLCAARTSELVLIVSAAIGHGKLRLSRFRGPEALVGGASALWLGEPSQHSSP